MSVKPTKEREVVDHSTSSTNTLNQRPSQNLNPSVLASRVTTPLPNNPVASLQQTFIQITLNEAPSVTSATSNRQTREQNSWPRQFNFQREEVGRQPSSTGVVTTDLNVERKGNTQEVSEHKGSHSTQVTNVVSTVVRDRLVVAPIRTTNASVRPPNITVQVRHLPLIENMGFTQNLSYPPTSGIKPTKPSQEREPTFK